MALSADALPIELWMKIMGYATDHDRPVEGARYRTLENMGPPTGYESMYHKRTLSLVLTSFRNIVSEFLYEAVAITCTDQLLSLCSESQQHLFRRYTISIDARLFFEGSIENWSLICRFLKTCTNLRIFRFYPNHYPWHPVTKKMILDVVDAVSLTVTTVVWHVGAANSKLAEVIYHILLRHQPLRTLEVRGYTYILPKEHYLRETQGAVAGEHLLHLDLDDTRSNFLEQIKELWLIPRLKSITTKEYGILESVFISVTRLEITFPYPDSLFVGLKALHHTLPNLQEILYDVNAHEPESFFDQTTNSTTGTYQPTITTVTITLSEGTHHDVYDGWHDLAAHLLHIPHTALPSLKLIVVRNFSLLGKDGDLQNARAELLETSALLELRGIKLCLRK